MIKFLRDGLKDSKTGKIYKSGDKADLGQERNESAVRKGYAEWVEAEKVEVKEVTEKVEKKTNKKK